MLNKIKQIKTVIAVASLIVGVVEIYAVVSDLRKKGE